MENSEFLQRVAASFTRQKFMQFIGAKLDIVRDGYCEISIPYREELGQQHGFFHAGIVGTLADNVAGYAAYSAMHPDSSILTVEFKINLLAPAKGPALLAKGFLVKKGKTLTVCRSEVFNVSDGKEELCAIAQSTLIELRNSSDSKK
ncbi:MAG: hypothetical protein FD123_2157 [Bacteroidetes bacterium]|nr:MAG: hypothetical protein FD123_2157 [Bacteroidota bacterium]